MGCKGACTWLMGAVAFGCSVVALCGTWMLPVYQEGDAQPVQLQMHPWWYYATSEDENGNKTIDAGPLIDGQENFHQTSSLLAVAFLAGLNAMVLGTVAWCTRRATVHTATGVAHLFMTVFSCEAIAAYVWASWGANGGFLSIYNYGFWFSVGAAAMGLVCASLSFLSACGAVDERFEAMRAEEEERYNTLKEQHAAAESKANEPKAQTAEIKPAEQPPRAGPRSSPLSSPRHSARLTPAPQDAKPTEAKDVALTIA
jgi:hypothetical protein